MTDVNYPACIRELYESEMETCFDQIKKLWDERRIEKKGIDSSIAIYARQVDEYANLAIKQMGKTN